MQKLKECSVRWLSGQWTKGADLLVGETFYYAEEAYMALDIIQKAGLPSVITIAPMAENVMRDGVSIMDVCKELRAKRCRCCGYELL